MSTAPNNSAGTIPGFVTQTVDAWLPVRTTVFDAEDCARIVDTGIKAFLIELPQALPILFNEIADVTISVEEPPATIASYFIRLSSIVTLPLFRYVRVTAKVTFEPSPIVSVNEPDPSLKELAALAEPAYYLGRALDLALDLSELSSPGCVWTAKGVVVIDGNILESITEKVCISEFNPRDESTNAWPPVGSLSLTSTVRWARSIGMLNAPLATSRLQRALAAYTRVVGLGMKTDGEVLFHAMQGLEAFYCDGIGDLRRQLAEKSKLWLGPTNATVNVVGQLYDLRSQYVHGAAKLQYRHVVADPWEHDEKAMTRLSSGSGFAARLLVASLQKCITECVTDLEWSFSFTTSRSNTI